MSAPRDAIVIGGGVNGLVCATLLAKAGVKTLVLERTDRVGGCARTTELAPGFRCPTLAHAAALDPSIVRSLGLERHGLAIVRPDAAACAPSKDGRALVLWRDSARAAGEIRAWSAEDASRYGACLARVPTITPVIRPLIPGPPRSIDRLPAGGGMGRLKSGRRFRRLGR